MATQVGFPKELSNEIDYSPPAGVSSYQVKVVPSNLSQVQSSTQSVGTTAGVVQLNGTSSNVIFDIPAGQGKSVFLDPRFTTLNFRANYEVVTAGTSTNIGDTYLRSSGYAHFDRCYIQSQEGVILDDINLVGLVQDALIQLEVDIAQRDTLASMYGFQFEAQGTGSINLNQGHKIDGWSGANPPAVGNAYYSYSMPLLSSLIGKGGKKFFQIGATNKLQLVLQTAGILPVTLTLTSATTGATVRVTLDNFSLNLCYVDIGMEGLKMLNKTGIQYYDGITYRVSSATLPATSGAVSLLTGLRGSSVRAIWTRASEGGVTSATSVNYFYDSKMPQATSIAYNINGMLVPPNPVDLLHAPATAFSMLQESNGSFNNYEFKSGMVPSRFFPYIQGGTLATDADRLIVNAGASSSAIAQCQFMFGQNLEKISKYGIMDGMNLNAGNTFLNMVLANASSATTVTFYFIAKMDIIYIHDTATGSISVRL